MEWRNAALGRTGIWALALACACAGRTAVEAEVHAALQDSRPQPAAAAGDASPLRLRTRLEFPTDPARPTGLLARDIDRDGRDELIVLTRTPGTLQVWSGLSDAGVAPSAPRTIAVADWALGPEPFGDWSAKDGPRLVAIAGRAEPVLELHDVRAIHAGSASAPALRVELPARPRALACGDLGADGVPEIAVVTSADELLLVRDGEIALRAKLDDGLATCARFANDGSALLVGFQGTRRVVRYEFPPGATVREADAISLAGLPRAILELDPPWPESENARWLVAHGDDGLAWLDADFALLREDRAPAIPAGLDLNTFGGLPTLLVLSQHEQIATVRVAGGVSWRAYAGQQPVACALGDYDADGILDAAFANADPKRVSLAFGDKHGGLTPHLVRTGRAPQAVAAAELDGDELIDLVVLCGLDGTLRTHLSKVKSLSGAPVAVGEGAQRFALADFDGGGALDVALARAGADGARVELWFGDGHGGFAQRDDSPPLAIGRSIGALLALDLEGDGAVEVIVSDPDAGRVLVATAQRSEGGRARFDAARVIEIEGTPREIALLAAGETATFAVALSDARHAGFALVRTSGADGALLLEAHVPLPVPVRLAAAGDLDGDGRTDLALATGGDGAGTLHALLRTKDGGWHALAPQPTGLRAHSLVCGDLDGDGRADLVLSAQNSHHLNAWLSRPGDPPALVRLPDLGVGTGPLGIALKDGDGDGVPEIVAACAFSDELATVLLR